MTFESVLSEAGFTEQGSKWVFEKYHFRFVVRIMNDWADVSINGNSILIEYIKRPERLKVLLDILLEER